MGDRPLSRWISLRDVGTAISTGVADGGMRPPRRGSGTSILGMTEFSRQQNGESFAFDSRLPYIVLMDATTEIHIERMTPNFARLSFLDVNTRGYVNPSNVIIVDKTFEKIVKPEISFIMRPSFLLTWTNEYEIRYDSRVIMQLVPRRKWTVHTYPDEEKQI